MYLNFQMTSTNTSYIGSGDTNSIKRLTPPQTTSQVCDSIIRSSKTSTLKSPPRVSLLNSQSPQSCNQNASYLPHQSNPIHIQLIVPFRAILNPSPPRYQSAFYSHHFTYSNQILNQLIAHIRALLYPLPSCFPNVFYPHQLLNQINNRPAVPMLNPMLNRPPPPIRYQNAFYPTQQSLQVRLQFTALIRLTLIISPPRYQNYSNFHEQSNSRPRQDTIQSQSTTQSSPLIHNNSSPPQYPLLNSNAEKFVLPEKLVKQDQPQLLQKDLIQSSQSKLNPNSKEFVLTQQYSISKSPDDINNNCSNNNDEILGNVEDGSNSNRKEEEKWKVNNQGL